MSRGDANFFFSRLCARPLRELVFLSTGERKRMGCVVLVCWAPSVCLDRC
jgi:hypothetical protein